MTNPLTFDCWTPLHLALRRGDVHIVRLLLNHGADGNYPDSNGRTPLHLAWRDGRDDIVQLLRNHGADTKYPDSDGWSSPQYVAQDGHKYIVRLLPDADADSQDLRPLHLLALWGLFSNRGANPNDSDGRDWTSLKVALRRAQDTIFVQVFIFLLFYYHIVLFFYFAIFYFLYFLFLLFLIFCYFSILIPLKSAFTGMERYVGPARL